MIAHQGKHIPDNYTKAQVYWGPVTQRWYTWIPTMWRRGPRMFSHARFRDALRVAVAEAEYERRIHSPF